MPGMLWRTPERQPSHAQCTVAAILLHYEFQSDWSSQPADLQHVAACGSIHQCHAEAHATLHHGHLAGSQPHQPKLGGKQQRALGMWHGGSFCDPAAEQMGWAESSDMGTCTGTREHKMQPKHPLPWVRRLALAALACCGTSSMSPSALARQQSSMEHEAV